MKSDHTKVWDSFEKLFTQRRWVAIRTSWPDFIGKPMHQANKDNDYTTITEFIKEGGVFTSPLEKNKTTSLKHPRGEIPEIVSREAVYWLHKSLHVLGASEMHVKMGLPTWSLASAYQSAFFAARSILAFFGISIAEMGKISVVVDLCREMNGVKSNKLIEIGAFDDNVSFRSIGVLFDHRQVWLLFQRLLRSSSCSIWPEGFSAYFSRLEIKKITQQRHGLHYTLDYWVLEDIHDFVFPEDFDQITPAEINSNRDFFDSEKPNFSLVCAVTLTRMALMLFNDLSSLTNRLEEDRKNLSYSCSEERHPLFKSVLQPQSSN